MNQRTKKCGICLLMGFLFLAGTSGLRIAAQEGSSASIEKKLKMSEVIWVKNYQELDTVKGKSGGTVRLRFLTFYSDANPRTKYQTLEVQISTKETRSIFQSAGMLLNPISALDWVSGGTKETITTVSIYLDKETAQTLVPVIEKMLRNFSPDQKREPGIVDEMAYITPDGLEVGMYGWIRNEEAFIGQIKETGEVIVRLEGIEPLRQFKNSIQKGIKAFK